MTRGKALIADPSALFREGLRRSVRQLRFETCAEGRDISEALSYRDGTEHLALIICTLDTQTVENNLAQLKELHLRDPSTKNIVMIDTTMIKSFGEELFPISDAVLERDISGEVLQRSIELALVGQKFFSAALLHASSPGHKDPVATVLPSRPLVAEISTVRPEPIEQNNGHDQPLEFFLGHPRSDRRDLTFSDRERQILGCLVRGDSNKVIARELSIAEATVKVHVKGLLRKLRTTNRTQAAVWALNSGLVRNGMEVLAAD